jgi:hypothetical protein
MIINPNVLGVASAIVAAILWITCSLLVVFVPGFIEAMSAGMMHGDSKSVSFTMTWTGFFWGLIAWVVWADIAGWLVAYFYNKLLPKHKG